MNENGNKKNYSSFDSSNSENDNKNDSNKDKNKSSSNSTNSSDEGLELRALVEIALNSAQLLVFLVVWFVA